MKEKKNHQNNKRNYSSFFFEDELDKINNTPPITSSKTATLISNSAESKKEVLKDFSSNSKTPENQQDDFNNFFQSQLDSDSDSEGKNVQSPQKSQKTNFETDSLLEKSWKDQTKINENEIETFKIVDNRNKDSKAKKSVFKAFDGFLGKFPLSFLLVFLAAYYFLFQSTFPEMQGILDIISFFFEIQFTTFRHLIQRYFEGPQMCCFVCARCRSIYIFDVRKQSVFCQSCKGCEIKESFRYSSLIENLKISFQDSSFCEGIQFYKTAALTTLNDIFGGFTFRKLKQLYFQTEKPDEINLVVGYNTDGFASTGQEKDSGDWETFVSIMNVHPRKRRKKRFNYMISQIPHGSSDIVFEASQYLLVEELFQMKNGIRITSKKQSSTTEYNVKCFLLLILTDLPARAMVLFVFFVLYLF